MASGSGEEKLSEKSEKSGRIEGFWGGGTGEWDEWDEWGEWGEAPNGTGEGACSTPEWEAGGLMWMVVLFGFIMFLFSNVLSGGGGRLRNTRTGRSL